MRATDGEPLRMWVDPELCVGGGQCEMLEPETFLVDEDTAVAAVIGSGTLPRERAEIVIDRCPGGAIAVDETPPTSPSPG